MSHSSTVTPRFERRVRVLIGVAFLGLGAVAGLATATPASAATSAAGPVSLLVIPGSLSAGPVAPVSLVAGGGAPDTTSVAEQLNTMEYTNTTGAAGGWRVTLALGAFVAVPSGRGAPTLAATALSLAPGGACVAEGTTPAGANLPQVVNGGATVAAGDGHGPGAPVTIVEALGGAGQGSFACAPRATLSSGSSVAGSATYSALAEYSIVVGP